ncbi:uncharacterized protein C1orf146 homolog isoform X1 [Takifugu rubripes]|uniref:Chromosome 1 open reading frame 146 n=1 Tax=Takifugu rubripes TaxID=31033 RepID=A0A3B5K0I5_TAKRU|nr:uncharacterized protein C1orf146 homolog isoform X1 [Takifugu rubripes]XP_029683649.1 uncharacterized protein C1orf146 homolog isoform X1 [Takifugu rubripes]
MLLFLEFLAMATQENAWKTTIIVSTSLQQHDLSQKLISQQHRIRFSHSIEAGAFIFPLSGTAFLLIDPADISGSIEDSGLIETIKSFAQVHRNSFLLLITPFIGKKEIEILSAIQHRFFGSKLKILPVRNNGDILTGMLTIAKATCKPYAGIIYNRMSLARAHIVESSPVWEMLRDML